MSQRREFRELRSPAAVRDIIDELSITPGTESIPIAEAGGRVLAERIDADFDVPGFDRAAMDGYAVRAADTFGANERDPIELRSVGSVHAGEKPAVTVAPETAAEISTGAVMPPGANAVVMVERTREREDGTIAIERGVAPGEHVMSAGADIGAGRRMLGAGRHLGPRDVAVLAAIGRTRVPVRRPPRVGIVSTGDELVRPGDGIDHDRGQIYDVNGHSIAAAVRAAGGSPHLYPHVGDDVARMRTVLEEASTDCDLILSSGSTSASAVDVIYDVIESNGELLAHGVAMKPGKPMLVGRMGEAAFVGLPGYPVSALMVFRRFVAGPIGTAAGRPPASMPTCTARMAAEERLGEGRMRLLPVGTLRDGDDTLLAYPVDKGSGATTSLTDADGVVEVPADRSLVEPGDEVTVHLFSSHVRPPSALVVGEEDPTFDAILDAEGGMRFLPVGSREGRRRFERGVPDLVLVADGEPPDGGAHVGGWEREWGLLVPGGNPQDVDGIASLVDRDLEFANLAETAVRTAFDARLDGLAETRGTSREDLTDRIIGYGVGRPALGSPARRVIDGDADVGIGLVAPTPHDDLDTIVLGTQQVDVYVSPDRRDKPAVSDVIGELATE